MYDLSGGAFFFILLLYDLVRSLLGWWAKVCTNVDTIVGVWTWWVLMYNLSGGAVLFCSLVARVLVGSLMGWWAKVCMIWCFDLLLYWSGDDLCG